MSFEEIIKYISAFLVTRKDFIGGIFFTVLAWYLKNLISLIRLKFTKEELGLQVRREKITLIHESSFSDTKKLYDVMTKISNSKSSDEVMQNLSEFELLLEHICILILSDTIIDTILKYRYYPFLKDIVESKMIERFYEVLDLPFSMERKKFLFDAYELGRKKFEKEVEKEVKKKWWNVFAMKGRKKVEKKVKKEVKKKWWNVF
jgi:hypothetical protein